MSNVCRRMSNVPSDASDSASDSASGSASDSASGLASGFEEESNIVNKSFDSTEWFITEEDYEDGESNIVNELTSMDSTYMCFTTKDYEDDNKDKEYNKFSAEFQWQFPEKLNPDREEHELNQKLAAFFNKLIKEKIKKTEEDKKDKKVLVVTRPKKEKILKIKATPNMCDESFEEHRRTKNDNEFLENKKQKLQKRIAQIYEEKFSDRCELNEEKYKKKELKKQVTIHKIISKRQENANVGDSENLRKIEKVNKSHETAVEIVSAKSIECQDKAEQLQRENYRTQRNDKKINTMNNQLVNDARELDLDNRLLEKELDACLEVNKLIEVHENNIELKKKQIKVWGKKVVDTIRDIKSYEAQLAEAVEKKVRFIFVGGQVGEYREKLKASQLRIIELLKEITENDETLDKALRRREPMEVTFKDRKLLNCMTCKNKIQQRKIDKLQKDIIKSKEQIEHLIDLMYRYKHVLEGFDKTGKNLENQSEYLATEYYMSNLANTDLERSNSLLERKIADKDKSYEEYHVHMDVLRETCMLKCDKEKELEDETIKAEHFMGKYLDEHMMSTNFEEVKRQYAVQTAKCMKETDDLESRLYLYNENLKQTKIDYDEKTNLLTEEVNAIKFENETIKEKERNMIYDSETCIAELKNTIAKMEEESIKLRRKNEILKSQNDNVFTEKLKDEHEVLKSHHRELKNQYKKMNAQTDQHNFDLEYWKHEAIKKIYPLESPDDDILNEKIQFYRRENLEIKAKRYEYQMKIKNLELRLNTKIEAENKRDPILTKPSVRPGFKRLLQTIDYKKHEICDVGPLFIRPVAKEKPKKAPRKKKPDHRDKHKC